MTPFGYLVDRRHLIVSKFLVKSYNSDYFNDLWTWNGSMWTWVSGANTFGQNGVYGTQGTPSPSNMPGARSYSAGWENNNNFWMVGGKGRGESCGNGIDFLVMDPSNLKIN